MFWHWCGMIIFKQSRSQGNVPFVVKLEDCMTETAALTSCPPIMHSNQEGNVGNHKQSRAITDAGTQLCGHGCSCVQMVKVITLETWLNSNLHFYFFHSQLSEHKLAFKVAATSLKLEIRLDAHLVGTNTRSGIKVIFMLIWLAHAFKTTATLHVVLFQA